MKSYKGRGIVLHTLKYGDTSLVAHVLTDVWGRRSYMVQGVRSQRGHGSKLALFQPMFPLEFEGLESPHRQMDRFREVSLGLTLENLPFDVRKTTIAMFMAETLYRLIRESEPNEELFRFVWDSVGALDALERGVSNFHLWFLVNLSLLLGFRPGNDYRPGCWFDTREGLYTPTPPLHPGGMEPSEASLLAELLGFEVGRLDELELNRERRGRFLTAMLNYYGYHLEGMGLVRSADILREVF